MKEKEKFAEALLGEQNGCESSITIEQFRASLKKTIVCLSTATFLSLGMH